MNSIDLLLDQVDWQLVQNDETPEGLYATHQGVLKIGDLEFRVYVLSDGNRVIDAEDMNKYLGVA